MKSIFDSSRIIEFESEIELEMFALNIVEIQPKL